MYLWGRNNCKKESGGKILIPHLLKLLNEKNESELFLARAHIKTALKTLKKTKKKRREKQTRAEDKASTINISTAGKSLSALNMTKGALIPSL